eukprot:scaffold15566_cov34-Cyclotella_meneghiniana.AAC.1
MDESNPPNPPPKKGYFYGKRKRSRSHSRQVKKGLGNQKQQSQQPEPAPPSTSDEQVPPSEPIPIKSVSYSNTTKKQYADMLASCQLELNDALQEIKKKDKLIEKLNNKLNRLSSATELARDKAREAKVYAKTVEQDSKKTTKKLKEEVAKAEKKLAQSQVIIDAEVDRVRTIEVGRRERAARVITQQMEKKLKRERMQIQSEMKAKELEYQAALKDKDSHLKIVKNIADARLDVTASLHSENIQLKKSHSLALDQKDILHRQAMTEQRKKAASIIESKDLKLRQQKQDIDAYQDFAFDVAVESQEISKDAAKTKKDSLKKVAAAEATATKRLHKFKDASEEIQSLKEELEAARDEMHVTIEAAHVEIRKLREQLERKQEEADEFEAMAHLAGKELENFRYVKVTKTGKPKTWGPVVTQLVVEMLANGTPPSAISANILSVCKLLIPDAPIIDELPSIRFVRSCRTVLLHLAKTLAAYEIASQEVFQQLFTDGTTRRQTEFQNVIIGVLTPAGYRRVALDGCILSEEHNAESVTTSILVAFQRSGKLLDLWRSVTVELYPDRQDLLDRIPPSSELTLAKMAKGFTMTDTCNTARRIQHLLHEEIKKICKEKGMSDEDIELHKSFCWQHLRNVWFGAVELALNNTLLNQLEESMSAIPSIYRVNMDIVNLYRAAEKMVGGTANYEKGDGKNFVHFKNEFHPTTFLYPLVRACGGTRQDLCVEGAPSILMNLPMYLQFLHWRMDACGTSGDGILATNLYLNFKSSEVIAQLRVLSILHIAICMPVRWLAGKTESLLDYDFGYYDMGKALDIMESAFMEIIDDPGKFLDEDFMMGLFSEISDKVDPFKAYLEYMFEEKLGNVVENTKSEDDKVLPYDLIRAAVFYPDRDDIRKTDDLCRELAVTAASAFLIEFRDERKATAQYLSSIGGENSLAVISESKRKAGLGKESSNSTSESLHGTVTHLMKVSGTIRLDHAAGDGMLQTNGHVDRNVSQYIKKNRNDKSDEDEAPSLFFQLPEELRITAMIAAKRGAPTLRKEHDVALKLQKEADLRRKRVEHQKNLENAKEEYIKAWDLIDIYHSERGWKKLSQAMRVFNGISSEPTRLKAVKEQITIRVKGFGWKEAAHAWSKGGTAYDSLELMKHFVDVILPMEAKLGIPSEPDFKLQDNTTKYAL